MGYQDFLTLEEAAKALGKSVQTLRRMIKRGELPAQQVKTPQGFNYVIKREDVSPTPEPEKVSEKLTIQTPIQTAYTPREKPPIQAPTSQRELDALLENAFYHVDRTLPSPLMKVIEMQHKEKMMLIHILERLQAELHEQNRQPPTLLEKIMGWFLR